MCIKLLLKYRLINFIFLLQFLSLTSTAYSQHALRIDEVQSERQQAAEVPVYFTSDSAITLIQFIIEYNSAQLQALSPVVELGSQAGGLTISLTNPNLPFPPTNPGADTNVLIQLSGGGTQTITGDSLEIARLKFFANGQYGDTLKVWFDSKSGRSSFTTPSLTDIQDENLQLTSGAVLIQDLTPPTSTITFPTNGFRVITDSLTISGTGEDSGVGLKKVEVSVDSGQTWVATKNTGTQFENWQYTWTNFAPGKYFLMSRAEDLNENLETVGAAISITVNTPTDLGNISADYIPDEFALLQNYPNPFNPSTVIGFQLPTKSHVRIEIFNLLGQKIKLLLDEKRHAGFYELTWDARNDSEERIPSGVYVLRMRANDFVRTRKLVVLQ